MQQLPVPVANFPDKPKPLILHVSNEDYITYFKVNKILYPSHFIQNSALKYVAL